VERLPGAHRLAFLEVAFQQYARDPRSHLDLARARGLADVLEGLRQRFRLGGHHRHFGRRHVGERVAAAFLAFLAAFVAPGGAAGDEGESDQREDKSTAHGISESWACAEMLPTSNIDGTDR